MIKKRALKIPLLLLTLLSFGWANTQAQTQLTNLPTVYITTDNGIDPNSKTVYTTGRIVVKSTDPTEELDVTMQIRGRGNSTWNAAKKPYRVKLDKKNNLLNNVAKEKDWVLLANDRDKTLIRNALAFKISEWVGLQFSPSVRFIDLVLNGNYVGNYQFTDQVEVGEHRVPIEKQEVGAGTLPAISGGYLIEVDGFASDPVRYRTKKNMPITIKYPKDDEINTAQRAYICGFIQRFESLLFSADFNDPEKGYKPLVDEESLVNWYIGSELTGNPDSFWSTYMYKFRDVDKFYLGPMWDYDIAFNNDSRLGDATRKLMREHAHEPKTWIKQLWKDDWFKWAVNERWLELVDEGILTKILDYIDITTAEIAASQKLNEEKWHKVSNYQKEVDNLKTYMSARVAFLTESFGISAPVNPYPNLGIGEGDNSCARITLYPNPVSDRLFVEVRAATDVQSEHPVAIQLYGVDGKCLYQNTFDSKNIEISVSELAVVPGFYLLKIKVGSDDWVNRKIYINSQ